MVLVATYLPARRAVKLDPVAALRSDPRRARVEYAHAQGIIHRDVKPENILFTGNNTACLVDFGVARALERAVGDPTTSTGIVRGTPAYMSPEQASGEKELDARTDVYSLACVMYEMLAGMPAFSGPTPQSIMAQRMTHGPRPVRVYRPSVPPALEAVIEKALMPAPADRFRSAKAFSDAIMTAVGDSQPGLTRSSTFRSRKKSRVRAAVAVGVGAAIVAATAALAWRSGLFTSSAAAADPNAPSIRLAVVPFDAPDPADSVWRYGFVDALSRSLDRAGPLRAVSPTTIANQWKGRADDSTARALGARTGAELVVYGQLTRTGKTGRDTLRATVWLADRQTNRTVQMEVRDDSAHVDRLIDSVAFRLLSSIGDIRRIGIVNHRSSLDSHSMAAIKDFLQGEQRLRRSDVSAAEFFYLRAINEDSTFALPLQRMRDVRRTVAGETDSLSFDYALRAGRLNRGLSPAESTLIVADTIAALLPRRLASQLPWSPVDQGLLRQRLEILRAASRAFPDDPQVWEALGETVYHYGDRLGATPEEALAAFARAIDCDSGYASPYFHAMELGMGLRDTKWLQDLTAKYLGINPEAETYLLVQRLLSDSKSAFDSAWIATLKPRTAIPAANLMRRRLDSTHLSERLWRSVAGSKTASESERRTARVWLVPGLSLRGQLKAAASYASAADLQLIPPEALDFAEAGVVTRDSADHLFARWAADADLRLALMSMQWWARQNNMRALGLVRLRFDSLGKGTSTPSGREIGNYGLTAATMYEGLARGDSAGALAAALQLNDSVCAWLCTPQRLITAQLLLRSGQADAAARLLDAHPPSASRLMLAEMEWHLARARVASALLAQRGITDVTRAHETQIARASYALIARAWASSDGPRFQSAAAEARTWLTGHGT